MAEILVPRLKDKSGADTQDTVVPGSFRVTTGQPSFITGLTVEMGVWPEPDVNGTNLPASGPSDITSVILAWTTNDSIVLPTLDHFACFTSVDGAGYNSTGTFSAGTHSATVSSPQFNSTLGVYLEAQDAEGNSLLPHSAPVLFAPTPYVTAFTAERVDALNVLLAWTTDDSITPSNLAGFYCFTSGDGAGYYLTGTFDANERGSTMGQLPFYESVLDLYLMAHDAAGKQISFLPLAVFVTQINQSFEVESIPSSAEFPDLTFLIAPGGEPPP